MTLNGWRIRWIGCGSGSEMSSSVIAAPPIEDAPGRLERMASTAAGGCPRMAAPALPRVLEQAGRPPGAVSVAWQAQHQPAAVLVPGEAQQRVGAVRAQQEAAPDERAWYRFSAVASECRRGRSVTLPRARCCRSSSRSAPRPTTEYAVLRPRPQRLQAAGPVRSQYPSASHRSVPDQLPPPIWRPRAAGVLG